MLNFRRLIRLVSTAALAMAAIWLTASSAGAQEFRTGDRIRVKTVSGPSGGLIGVYHASEPENLVIYTGESARAKIPWDDISRLQLSRGEHSNAGKGALIGLGVGGGLGLALGIVCASSEDACWGEPSVGDVAVATAMTGAMGAGVGALIGLATRSERWQTIPRDRWQIQVAPDPKGGVAVGINLRL